MYPGKNVLAELAIQGKLQNFKISDVLKMSEKPSTEASSACAVILPASKLYRLVNLD
jgi:hypothetical protein